MENTTNPLFLAGMLALIAAIPLLSTRARMKLTPIKKRFAAAKTDQRGENLISTILIISGISAVVLIGVSLFGNLVNNSIATKAKEIESGGSTWRDAKTPEPVKEIAPYDPSMLLNVLSVIGIIVLLAGIGYVATLLWKRQIKIVRIAKNDTEHISGIITEASKKISSTLLASASYETDLAKQIEYPLMTDVTQTPIAEYIQNMKRATFARDSLSKNPTLEIANDYFAVANIFETSFKAAENWAITKKWSTFSVEESRRLNDAKVSLALLEDSTTSPDQRNALYKRLEKLLTGLVNITDQVKRELSNKVPMLALESAK